MYSRVERGVDERINESVIRWFGHIERMKSDKSAKNVYVGKCVGSHSIDRLRNR